MKALMDLRDLIEDEIKKINKKADLTPTELESAYYAVDTIHCIDKVLGKDEEGYSNRMSSQKYYHDDRMSNGRYRGDFEGSYRRGRDPETGRYVSRDERPMSYDAMVSRLEQMRSNATNEQSRRMLDRWIDEAESR